MSQYIVTVENEDGSQSEITVEANSPEEAQQVAMGSRHSVAPSRQEPNALQAFGAGAAVGVGDTVDFFGSIVTAPIWMARKYASSKSDAFTDPGDYGQFMDLSNKIEAGVQQKFGDLSDSSAYGFGRAFGNVASSIGVGGALSATGRVGLMKAGKWLSTQPALQTTSALAGEGAMQAGRSGLLGEDAKGLGGQLTLGLLGSASPSTFNWGMRKIMFGGARGVEEGLERQAGQKHLVKALDEDIETATNFITTLNSMDSIPDWAPSVANLKKDIKEMKKARKALKAGINLVDTKNSLVNLLQATPGARHSIRKQAEAARDAMAARVKADAEGAETVAGKAGGLLRGYTDAQTNEILEGSFEQFRAMHGYQASKAYNGVAHLMADEFAEAGVAMPLFQPKRFAHVLSGYAQTADNGLLPPTIVPFIKKVAQELEESGGRIPYDRLETYRRTLQQQLNQPTLNTALPRRALRQMEQALRNDIQEGVRGFGHNMVPSQQELRGHLQGSERAIIKTLDDLGLSGINPADDDAILQALQNADLVEPGRIADIMQGPMAKYNIDKVSWAKGMIRQGEDALSNAADRWSVNVNRLSTRNYAQKLQAADEEWQKGVAVIEAIVDATDGTIGNSEGGRELLTFLDSAGQKGNVKVIKDFMDTVGSYGTVQGRQVAVRDLVQASFIKKLGSGPEGFSMETFLEQYRKLPKESIEALIPDAGVRSRLSAIARQAESTKILEAGHSVGYSQILGGGLSGLGGVAGYISGGIAPALSGAFGLLGGAFVAGTASASLLLNKRFLNVLLDTSKKKNRPISAFITSLVGAAKQDPSIIPFADFAINNIDMVNEQAAEIEEEEEFLKRTLGE